MNARLLALLSLLLFAAPAGAYTVKKGDTLSALAKANGMTVETIMRLNGLTSTVLQIGQTLKLPNETPATTTQQLGGVIVSVPKSVRMGDPLVIWLRGDKASEVTVRFPSEVGEDVRQPNEELRPVATGEGFAVVGRVVLGKTTPLTYEVRVGDETLKGQIPVGDLGQPIQHLNLPPSVSKVLDDPARAAEEAAVEKVYALRTPTIWTKPFAAPLANVKRVSSGFGQPRTYTAGGKVAYHYGTDYPAPVGTPILAINDGTVVIAGKYPVRGGLVVIDHGAGVLSLYFHQSKVTAKVGQKVVRGQKIGEVGNTGLSAGPHLHLELRVRGEGTQPLNWLGKLWP